MTALPVFTQLVVPQRPLPWWAWRRRARRLAFLELVARCEIRLSLNGIDQYAMDFRTLYQALAQHEDADVIRGVSFVKLAEVGNTTGDTVGITVCMPLTEVNL